MNVDYSQGGEAVSTSCTAATLATCSYSYSMHDWANTLQGYLEGDIKPVDGLTLTPGVKYNFYRMSVNAPINSSTLQPYKASQSWNSVLPSANLNYVIMPGWSAYAQVAKGFQAPPLNAMFTATPNTALTPTTTMNYQTGTVWKSDRVTVSADIYNINFNNYYSSYKDASKNTVYVAAGAATYKGAELEGTYYVGHHVSLYGNATFNSATYSNGQWIANAPIATGALGLIYQDQGGLYSSLIAKAVGRQEGLDAQSNSKAPPSQVDQYALPSYTYADFAIGYDLKNDRDAVPLVRSAKLGLKINNVFDQKSTIGYSGTDTDGSALYWVLPGRSFFGTAEIAF